MLIVEYNREQDKKILCIPGMVMAGECYEALAKEMQDYHFVCLTLDGFHRGTPDFTTLAEEVQRVERLLMERNFTEFDICLGSSLGTLVGTHLAKSNRIKIRKLWLDGGVVLYHSNIPKIEWFSAYHIFKKIAKDSHKGDGSLTFLGKKAPEDWAKRTLEARQSLSMVSLRNIIDTIVYDEIPKDLTQPMFLTFGAKESTYRQNAAYVKKLYPDAEISEEKGFGHLEYMGAKTGEYASRLRDWAERA